MSNLPAQPILFEINTWVWLNQLSQKSERQIRLGSVPEQEWEYLSSTGADIVWLMGVWERSPMGIEIAQANPFAIREYRQALPGFQASNLVGSPYSVRDYVVDANLGGPEGLAIERKKMAKFGLRLILDYVPNHVAPDHPWTINHPEYFIGGNEEDLNSDPNSFININGNILARGKDPNFAPWTDVVQLNAFDPGMRSETTNMISSISAQCDGLRLDMAMLLINRIFSSTWGDRVGQYPETEYWPQVISEVKRRNPGTLFIAETYWDTEHELQGMGFDYCYDKKLYDFVRDGSPAPIYHHLLSDITFQNGLVRFLENHDEQRAIVAFPDGKWKVAAFMTSTLPGMRMFHQGQFEGRRVRIPVQLDQGPFEVVNGDVQTFYHHLLDLASDDILKSGKWTLRTARSAGGRPLKNCLSWCWSKGKEEIILFVNLGRSSVKVSCPADGEATVSRINDWTQNETIRNPQPAENGRLNIEIGRWDAVVIRNNGKNY